MKPTNCKGKSKWRRDRGEDPLTNDPAMEGGGLDRLLWDRPDMLEAQSPTEGATRPPQAADG